MAECCGFDRHGDIAVGCRAWTNGAMDRGWLTKCVLAVMDRDRRLTGYLRGQTDQALAPAGFEFTNGWRVSVT